MDNPRIKPWLRPVTRRAGEVQFGVADGGAIVEGLTREESALLARLDGTISRSASFEEAGRLGIAAGRWRELLDLVERLGVLEPAVSHPETPSPSRPHRSTHVLVDGVGDLARECAILLRRCGFGRVTQGRTAADVALAAPQLSPADVVVLVAHDALDPRRGDPWLRRGTPHLPVVPSGPRVQIGPLIVRSATSPCLWCLDLHRADRDDDWPTLLAQLCGTQEHTITAPTTPPDGPPELDHLAAGVVGLFTTGLLSGDPAPLDVSVELSLPWPRMDHRRWSVHPRCSRHRRVASGAA